MARQKSDISAIRGRSYRSRQQRRYIPVLLLVATSLILIITSWVILSNRGDAQTAMDFQPEDVVYDSPIHAVHEMGGSNLPSIPFLPKGDPQPEIVIPITFHNFGSVGESEVIQQKFVIANQGQAPLTISRAYTTCDCTTADFTASVIPPGKVSIMTLTYDAGFHDARGQTVRRGVIIENNDPNNPQMEIWAQASLRNTQ